MAFFIGNRNNVISISDYFNLLDLTNKIYADKTGPYSSLNQITSPHELDYGWGNVPAPSAVNSINHESWNEIIARVNLIINHIGSNNSLYSLIPSNKQISVSKFNDIKNFLLNNLNKKNDLSSSIASINEKVLISRSLPFDQTISTEIEFVSTSLNSLRYWFNSGSKLRFKFFSDSLGSTYTYNVFNDIYSQVDTVIFDIFGCTSINNVGTTTNLGFYNLDNTYKLLWTSPTGNAANLYNGYNGYNGYDGYGSYNSEGFGSYGSVARIKIYGKISLGNYLVIKIQYIVPSDAIVDGNHKISISYYTYIQQNYIYDNNLVVDKQDDLYVSIFNYL